MAGQGPRRASLRSLISSPALSSERHGFRGGRGALANSPIIVGEAGACRRGPSAAPVQAGQRRHVERTNAWHSLNRLQRCYERREDVIDAFFDLADAIITVRSLIRKAWTTHRWIPGPHIDDDHIAYQRDHLLANRGQTCLVAERRAAVDAPDLPVDPFAVVGE